MLAKTQADRTSSAILGMGAHQKATPDSRMDGRGDVQEPIQIIDDYTLMDSLKCAILTSFLDAWFSVIPYRYSTRRNLSSSNLVSDSFVSASCRFAFRDSTGDRSVGRTGRGRCPGVSSASFQINLSRVVMASLEGRIPGSIR
jgi:hypothetical protein